ncbi:hypothetical protein DSCW_48480 [Desulfosarcina widdelii]|uniref:Elp3/MiaA/NifB-like radical SAM core domain-containing protein n=3 Tax=Desulfosarcina TaxID=2299 RepID=A0A5K7ZCH3_9BACT|nr:hypothetical protein DSCW_48480 [Desulfosarcina widdelii]
MEISGIRYTRIYIDIFREVFGVFYKNKIPALNDIETYFKNHEARILKDLLKDQIQKKIIDRGVPIVGFSIPFAQQFIPALILAYEIKNKMHDVHICFGGPVITLLSDQYLKDLIRTSPIDSCVKYDGEIPLLKLLNFILHGKPIDEPNCFLSNKSSVLTPIVFKSFRVRTASQRHKHNRLQKKNIKQLPMETPIPIAQSTGCYWGQCSFCDYINLHVDKVYRSRPVKDIIDDIKYYIDMGFSNFRMLAEAIPPRHANEIANNLTTNNIDIKWHSFLRVDNGFSINMLEAMNKSGFSCTVGMEHSNNCALKILNKGYNQKIIRKFFEKIRIASLSENHLNIIVGMPGITYAQEMETLEFCKEYTDIFNQFKCSIFTLTNTSEMGKNPQKYGIIINEDGKANKFNSHGRISSINFYDPNGMTSEEKHEILKLYEQLNQELRSQIRFNGYRNLILTARTGAYLEDIYFIFDRLSLQQMVNLNTNNNDGYFVVNMSASRRHQVIIDKKLSDMINIFKDKKFNFKDIIEFTTDENIALQYLKEMVNGSLVNVV